MNWSKGFFRVWVVFSVLWMAGFLFAAYLSSPYFPELYVARTTTGLVNAVSEYSPDGKVLIEMETQGQLKSFKLDQFPELTFFAAPNPKEQTVSKLSNFAKEQQQQIISKHNSDWFDTLITAALFALGLLVIGSALAWALRGFKRPTTKA
jgi:hypothetical protein